MPIWIIPLLVQAFEALVVGGVAFTGAMAQTHDAWSSLQVALVAVGAKLLPRQTIPIGNGAKSTK